MKNPFYVPLGFFPSCSENSDSSLISVGNNGYQVETLDGKDKAVEMEEGNSA